MCPQLNFHNLNRIISWPSWIIMRVKTTFHIFFVKSTVCLHISTFFYPHDNSWGSSKGSVICMYVCMYTLWVKKKILVNIKVIQLYVCMYVYTLSQEENFGQYWSNTVTICTVRNSIKSQKFNQIYVWILKIQVKIQKIMRVCIRRLFNMFFKVTLAENYAMEILLSSLA